MGFIWIYHKFSYHFHVYENIMSHLIVTWISTIGFLVSKKRNLSLATVEEALAHPYLARLHDTADEPVCLEPFSFDFEQATGEEQIKDMIYQEAISFNPEYA